MRSKKEVEPVDSGNAAESGSEIGLDWWSEFGKLDLSQLSVFEAEIRFPSILSKFEEKNESVQFLDENANSASGRKLPKVLWYPLFATRHVPTWKLSEPCDVGRVLVARRILWIVCCKEISRNFVDKVGILINKNMV